MRLFGGLFPRGGVGFRLGLELELGQLLALAVAEQLVAAGAVLRRASDGAGAVPGGGLHSERRVGADAHGGNPGVVADLIGERRLENAAVNRLGVRRGLWRLSSLELKIARHDI